MQCWPVGGLDPNWRRSVGYHDVVGVIGSQRGKERGVYFGGTHGNNHKTGAAPQPRDLTQREGCVEGPVLASGNEIDHARSAKSHLHCYLWRGTKSSVCRHDSREYGDVLNPADAFARLNTYRPRYPMEWRCARSRVRRAPCSVC